MELWAIVLSSLFIVSFISLFGKKIMTKISKLFTKSFMEIPLRHFTFLMSNIDNIIIISVFFLFGILYVVYYDVDLGKSTKNKELKSEKHKFSFKENLENSNEIKKTVEVVKGIDVSDIEQKALMKIMDLDIERDLQVTNYENICDENDIHKLKQKCSLLTNKDTCNKPKCCTWCNNKGKCSAANNNFPIFDEDMNCFS